MTYPCAGRQDIFFPENQSTKKANEAKAICNTCHFKQECLEIALQNNDPYGIWGGTSPRDRRKLRVGYPTSKLFYPPKREPMKNIDRDPAFMNSGFYANETASSQVL